MTAAEIIQKLAERDIRLAPDGDCVAVDGPDEALTDEVIDIIRRNKPAILEALATPKPTGAAWREDAEGRLWFSDGCCYAPLVDGAGWVLVKHPTRRLIAPGTMEVRQ